VDGESWGYVGVGSVAAVVIGAVVKGALNIYSARHQGAREVRADQIAEMRDVIRLIDEERARAVQREAELRERYERLEEQWQQQGLLLERLRGRVDYLEDSCQRAGVTVRPFREGDPAQADRPKEKP
jgi:hypothetical protein